MTMSLCIFLRVRNISDNRCGEIQNTYFMFNNFFSPEDLAVYEMMSKSDNIIRRMCFVCWINRATDTHSEYICICIILTAFRRQQWLRERASILRYTYIACLVFSIDPLSYQTFPWHCVTESVAQCHGVCQAWRLPTFATSTVFSLTFSSEWSYGQSPGYDNHTERCGDTRTHFVLW